MISRGYNKGSCVRLLVTSRITTASHESSFHYNMFVPSAFTIHSFPPLSAPAACVVFESIMNAALDVRTSVAGVCKHMRLFLQEQSSTTTTTYMIVWLEEQATLVVPVQNCRWPRRHENLRSVI